MNSLLISVIAVAVFGIAGYVAGRNDGRALADAQNAKVSAAIQASRDAMTQAAVDAIAAIEVQNVYKTERLEKQIVEKPVYRECIHDDIAFRMLNDSLSPPEKRQEFDPALLPGTDADGG